MTQQQGALSLLHALALAHIVRHVCCSSQQFHKRFADALGCATAAARCICVRLVHTHELNLTSTFRYMSSSYTKIPSEGLV